MDLWRRGAKGEDRPWGRKVEEKEEMEEGKIIDMTRQKREIMTRIGGRGERAAVVCGGAALRMGWTVLGDQGETLTITSKPNGVTLLPPVTLRAGWGGPPLQFLHPRLGFPATGWLLCRSTVAHSESTVLARTLTSPNMCALARCTNLKHGALQHVWPWAERRTPRLLFHCRRGAGWWLVWAGSLRRQSTWTRNTPTSSLPEWGPSPARAFMPSCRSALDGLSGPAQAHRVGDQTCSLDSRRKVSRKPTWNTYF